MIYINETEIPESKFVSLLEKVKKNLVNEFKENNIPNNLNGVIFEGIVFEKMVIFSKGTDFEGHIQQTGLHAFPDIVAKKLYGVEVKMTVADKWTSIGNSVLENTRVEDMKTIYMFFGKFGTDFDIKYRKYQECLSDVAVTHSPRYKIDMNLPTGDSIFDKIKIEYDLFREDEASIKKLKEYYRRQLKEGEELWWIDPTLDEQSVSPIIKSLKLMDRDTRDRFIKESYLLFPEIFGNSRVKYERVAAYLITEYNSVYASLRDIFTSKGKKEIKFGTIIFNAPRLFSNFLKIAPDILKLIETVPIEKMEYYWNSKISADPLSDWKVKVCEYVHKSNPKLNLEDIRLFLDDAFKQ